MSSEDDPDSLGLESITPPTDPPEDRPDRKTLEEKRVWQRHEKKVAAARLRSFNQNITERKRYAKKIFWMVSCWLLTLVILLLLAGAHQIPLVRLTDQGVRLVGAKFDLSDKVLISVIAGTTVDLIGLFFLVTSYLFRHPLKEHKTAPGKTRPRK